MAGGGAELRNKVQSAIVRWVIGTLALVVLVLSNGPLAAAGAQATAVQLSATAKATTFELTLSEGLTAQVYTLASPYRVVLDLPDLDFRLDPSEGKKGKGLISAFRYGLFAEHKARVVIDTKGPVKIASAGMTRIPGGTAVKLTVILSPTDAASFGNGTGASRSAAPPTPDLSGALPLMDAEPKAPKAHAKPVIVIDPGHGGIDPGALGANNVSEKTIVLAVALQLKSVLAKTGQYDVRLTRTDDVFVSLDRRLKFSSESSADLFISLHADSIEQKKMADSIRGATVYTLSNKASDEQARIMAEKENASDLIAGIQSTDQGGEEVKNILIDLLKRETSNFSQDFSRLLVKKLKKNIATSRIPERSAAFKVLKQTHAPSVLVELGYVSNKVEEQEMMTVAWQSTVAEAIAAAVETYFNKRTVSKP
ncbi:N-acetylmuramoyl-L-alanine amidase [Hyphomicrobium methylovorum]|uniref:N-acetylmuramoyl-L-alanine amidase n=1 Tax=Hyphomicrobium methylovorum TaxID=84 RepID=UPI0015E7974C|nr:N-acetylmuramoyl-L-alanine amidase [Hyphomicrobium methylovorum]MBA2125375.1 N-acetylmuramoyl-L-alanine amidase [Hyphomicrobium methylovorum]